MNKIFYFGNFNCKNGFAAVNRALGNSKCFSSLGFSTCIYCDEIMDSIANSNYCLENNIKFIKKPFSGFRNYCEYSFYCKEIKKLSKDDIVILYNFPSLPFSKILKKCKEKGIIVLSDVTEWYDSHGISFPLKLIKKIDSSIRMKLLNKKVDGLIVISNYLLNFYSDLKIPIVKVYPVMDYVLFESQHYNCFYSKKDFLTFGYVGNNRKYKDEIESFFPLFKEKNKLIFIGNYKTKEKYSNYNIEFLGSLDRKRLVPYYRSIDYSVIVRKQTRANNAGFPTKFAESIVLGVPIICNDFSDTSIFISNYNCGYMIDKISDVGKIIENQQKKIVDADSKKMFLSDFYVSKFGQLLKEVKKKEFL